MSTNLNIFNESSIKDFEFIGFSFNGRHSSEFKLTVVATSDMQQRPFNGDYENNTLSVSGYDGEYYFGTKMHSKKFTLSVAFDSLNGNDFVEIQKWLNPKVTGKLIFDEHPYKYYYAKLNTVPVFNYVPFEQIITNGIQHIYKGQIDLEFIAFIPYAYSDYCLIEEVPIWNGSTFISGIYNATNLPGWLDGSGLFSTLPTNPELAKANSLNGFIHNGNVIGDIYGTTYITDFYNGGNVEVPINFTITINSAYTIGNTWEFKNTLTGQKFILHSLKYLTPLADDNSSWTIICNSEQGLITGYSATNPLKIYNLNALHNGEFLKVIPGHNYLNSNRTINHINIDYKYKYQ